MTARAADLRLMQIASIGPQPENATPTDTGKQHGPEMSTGAINSAHHLMRLGLAVTAARRIDPIPENTAADARQRARDYIAARDADAAVSAAPTTIDAIDTAAAAVDAGVPISALLAAQERRLRSVPLWEVPNHPATGCDDPLTPVHVTVPVGERLYDAPAVAWDEPCRDCGTRYKDHPGGDGISECPGDFGPDRRCKPQTFGIPPQHRP